MNWLEVQVFTTSLGIEAISGILLNLAVKGWVVEDPQELAAYLNQPNKPWDYVADSLMQESPKEAKLIFYLPEDEQGRETLAQLKGYLSDLADNQDFGSLQIKVNNRDPKEWEETWKQFYKPFKVGSGLVIKPSWEVYVNPKGENRKILEVDPNASFGTGQHQTTRLCLEATEEFLKPQGKVLDIGCGTGILGIGALLLGAAQGVGVDIEAHSAATAEANALKNGIDLSCYQAYAGNILTDQALVAKLGTGYDLVLANIVADVIIAMSALFAGFLNQNGVLICSGIIAERENQVKAALAEAGLKILTVKEDSGWVAIVATK